MNLFTPLSSQERKQLVQNRESARKARLQSIEQARKCLGFKEFKRYKEKYLKSREFTINALLELREPDPVKYAFKVQEMLGKLRSLGTLLNSVEKDAGKNEQTNKPRKGAANR